MPLIKPAFANVSPGQPVTAQGWNAIIGGVSDLYDAVLAFGTGTLEIQVVTGGHPVAGATVIAQPLGPGQPLEALPPHGDDTSYRITGLTNGNCRLFVSADGYRPATADVAVPHDGAVVVALTLAGVVVPDLFGESGQDALAALGTAGLSVELILDIMGREVSRSPLPPQYQNQPVLLQLPAAGTVVDPAAQRLRLVMAAAIEQTPVVTMPSLVGLSADEVGAVLNQLGLVLGRTTTRRTTSFEES